ncbi:ATP-binding protein [Extibacter muris]|uniref:ATP-binding protein n=1 Tax=Extibacter muris TaxID=1796622 RepID=UPI001D087191|nr:SbcC/MukB-like Walker B domain-containing protein [Extibacter muris]MCB6203834.1 AAA family ATPase [Extibacter muris]MCQ4665525.1 AAA family ATPase [Extibacter muris]MCQ4694913.1 AAA family ATPase [Extibacter muris]
MKKLQRMKLINWHRFENCTIEFGDATLISGENGAGKSTLLDAIQFVVTCSTNYFNKAAHENGKRKLTGYIRCKTGKENRPYEREGEISAHIALEFYEESRNRYFIIGAVIDSATEGQETVVRYLIDDTRLNDDMFMIGRKPKSINEFKVSNSKVRQWCRTQTEAKKVMKARFGRIEDKFFRLIPKALAFKPINDIKDFVYSYVLDEKEVNIDVLRENVRTYQELERTLENVKKRIVKLEQIEQYHREVEEGLKRDRMYEYFLSQAELDLIKSSIVRTKDNIQSETYRLEQEEKLKAELVEEKNQKQEMETNLRVEMKQNKEYLVLEEQKKKLEDLKDNEQYLLAEKSELKGSIKKALELVYQLLGIKDVAPCIGTYEKTLKNIEHLQEAAEAKIIVEQVIRYKREMHDKLQRKIAEVQIHLNTKEEEQQELNQKIKKLSQKKLSYAGSVDLLLQTIREEFERIGRKPEPYVLCEMLEIEDESWRNAVEGYLNTQRFYILTEPENFDIALGIYDRLRGERKVYGVGLINTQKMEQYDVVPEGTLASMVSSKNIYARRFTNMVLGKVKMCDRYDQLKAYPTSITKQCMKYQNRVASAIKPEIYEVPFIGGNAFKVQLEQAKLKKKELKQEINDYRERKVQLENTIKWLETEADIDIKYRLDTIPNLMQVQKSIASCRENIKTLEKNSNFIQKQVQLETLEKIRKELEGKISESDRKYGRIEENIKAEKIRLEQYKVNQMSWQSQVAQLAFVGGDAFSMWIAEYEKQTEQKTLEQFKENYERRRKANQTTWEKSEEKMKNIMIDYKTEHDFGASANMEGYPEFALVYERLRTSELLTYEEKVQTAKQAAEDEFREQFLAKLQENMKQAQSEFKELNHALKDIDFSNERYEFIYMPSRKYRNYYEMLMDDFNAVAGESIFSGIFHENHKEVIEELFDRLALDHENEVKALDEFTDYRTYMDYDIKIIHKDGNHSYYSKVCEEKSGGETQTPFYVTVAASFVQLYSNNIGGEAIGLIMFDEAFNNMDDERIGGVLEFLRRLPLQIIIAAPPDKIQYISPVVEETLLVMTDQRVNYVEEYFNGTI